MTQTARTPWIARPAGCLRCSRRAGVATAAETPLRLVSVTRLGRGEGPARHGLRDPGGRSAQADAGRGPDGGQCSGGAGAGPDPRTQDRSEVRRLDAAAGATRLPLGREDVSSRCCSATSSTGRSTSKCTTSTVWATCSRRRSRPASTRWVERGSTRRGARSWSARPSHKAVDDARLNADALARAAGAKLGPVQSLSASGTRRPCRCIAERGMVGCRTADGRCGGPVVSGRPR